jgi:uncharacterized protein
LKDSTVAASSGAHRIPRVKPSFLGIILKVTERCNLACPYCYFFFRGDDSYQQHPPVIAGDTVAEVIAFIRTAVLETGVGQVRIGLHGGEPLLLKADKFSQLCQQFRAALDPICDLMLLVQTNGVLVNQEWVDVFSRFQVRVGVSIDGDEAVHNIFRINKKGRGTYAETRRGWDLLNRAMAERRIPSAAILCVVSPEQSGAKVLKHFAEELHATGLNFLLPDVNHDSPEATERYIRGCGDFLIDAFNAWAELSSRKVKITVRRIDELVGALMDDELCRLSAVRKYEPLGQFVVSSNGEISPDDVIRGLDPRFRNFSFNVGHSRYDEVQDSPAWQELEGAQRALPTECQGCIWKNICGGGSCQHRFSGKNGFDNPSVFCPSLKRFYAHVTQQVVAAGYPVEEIERRLETTWA